MPTVRYDGVMGPQLRARGPIVELRMLREDRPDLHVQMAMLIDTGASRTIVDAALVSRLGVAPIDGAKITGVNNVTKWYPVYRVELILGMSNRPLKPGKRRPPTTSIGFKTRVAALPRHGDYDGLLGRDFLANFDLRYTGAQGRFTLSKNVSRKFIASRAAMRDARPARRKMHAEQQRRPANP